MFHIHHLVGGLANRLHHDSDRSLVSVEIGDSEWNPLTGLIDADHEEMAGLACLGHVGRLDLPQEGNRTKLLAFDDLVHASNLPCFRLPQCRYGRRLYHRLRIRCHPSNSVTQKPRSRDRSLSGLPNDFAVPAHGNPQDVKMAALRHCQSAQG